MNFLFIKKYYLKNNLKMVNKSPLLRIRASEVAGYIGKNEYTEIDVLILKIWKNMNCESLQKALKRNSLEIKELNNYNYNKKSKSNVFKYNNYKKSTVNTKNGLDKEKSTIEIFEHKKNVIVTNKNDKIYNIFINKPHNKLIIHNIILNGAVDGIVNNEYIVEIKNRQKRFFDEIPIYEKIQIIVYMKLLNLYKCYHVQRFKDDIIITEIKYTKDEFSKEWEYIENRLIEFIEYFEKIYFSLEFQDLFLNKKFRLDNITGEIIVSGLGIVIKRNNSHINPINKRKKYIMLLIFLTKILFYRYKMDKLKIDNNYQI